MGVGTLRRHYDTEPEPEEPGSGPLAQLERPLSENTVDVLAAALEHFEVSDADLEPGSGSGGNVIKADRVEALTRLMDGEPREDVIAGGGSGDDEEGGEGEG